MPASISSSRRSCCTSCPARCAVNAHGDGPRAQARWSGGSSIDSDPEGRSTPWDGLLDLFPHYFHEPHTRTAPTAVSTAGRRNAGLTLVDSERAFSRASRHSGSSRRSRRRRMQSPRAAVTTSPSTAEAPLLQCPGRPMLAVELQIGLRDAVRVGRCCRRRRSGLTVPAGAVFLRPADRSVDRNIMTWMLASIPAPCSGPIRTWQAMAKAPLLGKPFRRHLHSKMIVPWRYGRSACFRASAGGLLADQNALWRCVPKGREGHVGLGIGYRLHPKMPGTRPSILCTTSVGGLRSRTRFRNNRSTAKGCWHRRHSGARRATPPGPGPLVRGPGRDGDTSHRRYRRNSLAQLELIPGPPPTMRATSCTEDCRVMLSFCPGAIGSTSRGLRLPPRGRDPTRHGPLHWRDF